MKRNLATNSWRLFVGGLSHYLQASKHPKVIKSGCLAGFLLKSFSGLLHFIFQRSWKGIRDLEFWNLFETTPSVLTRKSLRSIVHLVGHPWIAFHRACHVQDRGLSSNVAVERLKIGGSGHGCPLSPEIITWCHVSSQFISSNLPFFTCLTHNNNSSSCPYLSYFAFANSSINHDNLLFINQHLHFEHIIVTSRVSQKKTNSGSTIFSKIKKEMTNQAAPHTWTTRPHLRHSVRWPCDVRPCGLPASKLHSMRGIGA